MKLYYRGLVCELNPTQIANRKSKKSFQSIPKRSKAYNFNSYRVNFPIDRNNVVAKLPLKPIFCRLIYRGLAYWLHSHEQREMSDVTLSANTFLFDNCFRFNQP